MYEEKYGANDPISKYQSIKKEAPYVSQSAVLFAAMLEKMKQSDEYIEDIGEALKELKKDPVI